MENITLMQENNNLLKKLIDKSCSCEKKRINIVENIGGLSAGTPFIIPENTLCIAALTGPEIFSFWNSFQNGATVQKSSLEASIETIAYNFAREYSENTSISNYLSDGYTTEEIYAADGVTLQNVVKNKIVQNEVIQKQGMTYSQTNDFFVYIDFILRYATKSQTIGTKRQMTWAGGYGSYQQIMVTFE